MFGKEILEQYVLENPGTPLTVLLENYHHLIALNTIQNGKFTYGCGSYLFDGLTYSWYSGMAKKQEALIRAGKESTYLLEVGVYLGHSLLLLLLSNPTLKLECIDIDSELSPKAVEYLNAEFGNRITFHLGDALTILHALPSDTFDAVHIDADHYVPAVRAQFYASIRLVKDGSLVIFDDYEATQDLIDGFIADGTLAIVDRPMCKWTNIVTRITKD